MFDKLCKGGILSKIHSKTGFNEIRVEPRDIENTTFKSKYVHFEYLLMPGGLCNASATFQSLMNQIFHDCIDEFFLVHIVDILICTEISRTL